MARSRLKEGLKHDLSPIGRTNLKISCRGPCANVLWILDTGAAPTTRPSIRRLIPIGTTNDLDSSADLPKNYELPARPSEVFLCARKRSKAAKVSALT
jgi:hypothetical protein